MNTIKLSEIGVQLILLENEVENNFREVRRYEAALHEATEKLRLAKVRWNDNLVRIARIKQTPSIQEMTGMFYAANNK